MAMPSNGTQVAAVLTFRAQAARPEDRSLHEWPAFQSLQSVQSTW